MLPALPLNTVYITTFAAAIASGPLLTSLQAYRITFLVSAGFLLTALVLVAVLVPGRRFHQAADAVVPATG